MPLLPITNPHDVELDRPFVYCIVVESPTRTYRYVGRASATSRLDAYERNIKRAIAGVTKRPAVKRDGQAQSSGNQKYRFVHLVLLAAVSNNWPIRFYPLANCEARDLAKCERSWSKELAADMNAGPGWSIDERDELLARIK